MIHLVWFRADLRCLDHAALLAASAAGARIVGCFLLADRQWQEHDWSPAKVAFTLAHLRSLSADLAALGIPLLVRRAARFADAPKAIAALCRETQATVVHAIHEYEVDEQTRDDAVASALAAHGIPLERHHDQCILPPGSVLTGSGGAYKVFTPFKRRFLELLDEQALAGHGPPAKQRRPQGLTSDAIPERLPAYGRPVCDSRWAIGESQARDQLQTAVEERLQHYDSQRDLPARNGTSRLSPYLASGVVSASHCLRSALAANGGDARGGGLGCWISELIWRDFYRHILVAWPRVCRHQPFDLSTADLPWRHDPDQEAAWQQGRTGIPIVDAAMRQLLDCGWMHNRLRMVTAMFFSKNCLLDWRRGEAFFMRHLIDGDLASNNGGWQWSASTGCDAAPYFRIFNPVSQSRRFDPEGRFLRRYLPELATLDDRSIHDPSPEQRRACGYPTAIVDLKRSRQRAIDLFRG